jgi:hypothetical protein
MNKRLIILCVVLASAVAASAQVNKTVDSTRKRYAEIAEKARLAESDEEKGQYGELVMNELEINKLNHPWRAIGIHRDSYKFFYRGGDSEDHMYPDELVLVKVSRSESNRNYGEEFLYSATGELMFYFQKAENDEMSPAERRVYFSAARAIRIVEDTKTRDRMTTKDASTVREILATSVRLKSIFATSIKL